MAVVSVVLLAVVLAFTACLALRKYKKSSLRNSMTTKNYYTNDTTSSSYDTNSNDSRRYCVCVGEGGKGEGGRGGVWGDGRGVGGREGGDGSREEGKVGMGVGSRRGGRRILTRLS